MHLTREDLHAFVYEHRGWGRYTQDSPVMPDVWFGYGADPNASLDLLLEPYRGVTPGTLASAVRKRLAAEGASASEVRLAYDESYVAVRLTLEQVIVVLLPLTLWWKEYTGKLSGLTSKAIAAALEKEVQSEGVLSGKGPRPLTGHGIWFLRLAGAILAAGRAKGDAALPRAPEPPAMGKALAPVLGDAEEALSDPPLLWSVNRNRGAVVAVWDSRKAVKADASEQIFALDCADLAWAILDTGIDARHTAFRKRDPKDPKGTPLKLAPKFGEQTRVVATYDFTRIRTLLEEDPKGLAGRARAPERFRERLMQGLAIDWELLEPHLRIPHDAGYVTPGHAHGTHVAGILASDWRMTDPGYDADDENDVRGMCPTIRLYDLRVLDAKGKGDEFSVMAALQFVRYLNARSHHPLIHGVNLSLSIPHDVSNYACGRTPVCNEAQRLHASGVVVVAAAGNEGYVHYLTRGGESSAYRNISITDPGNTECILTVGATHGRRPHAYGVSYFSSRGPTGDGRMKPDLVAPGEKIKAPAPGDTYDRADGTSMAAPHVSGAAALLLARHTEFIGDPGRVKEILVKSATDLGRERHFQGAGLVDVLRAIQSV